MADIDLTRAGATTILTCGTTCAPGTSHNGHYVFIQQGLNSFAVQSYAKKIYDKLAQYAPAPPSGDWDLYEIGLSDYKSWHCKEFYKIHAEYKFRGDREKYSKEIEITPDNAAEIYRIFQEGVYKTSDQPGVAE